MGDSGVARTRVKDLCSVRSGYTLRGRVEPSTAGVLAIQLGDLDDPAMFNPETLVRVDAPLGRYEVNPGDVLFRSRGHRTFASLVPDTLVEPTIAIMPLFIIRPHDGAVDPSFLAWALNQADAQRYFRKSSQGQTIQMVSKQVLEDAPVALPPRDCQQQIATVAELSHRQLALERRLLEQRYSLLSLQLADAAHDFPHSLDQNRNTR